MTRRLVVEADGGSRGNPGVAGYGALVRDSGSGEVLAERAAPLGKQSNNVAEYTGLVEGLRAVRDHEPGAVVTVRMDSKLVVEQMSGRWKIKHEDMKRLAAEARGLVREIVAAGGSVAFEWIPREKNKAADKLSNDGMDGRSVRHDLWQEATPEGGEPGGEDADAPRARGAQARDTSEREPETVAATTRKPDLGRPTRIVFVRHGVTNFTTSGRLDGRGGVDPVLTDAGRAQAEAAARAVQRLLEGTDATVITSSLTRAVETGAPIARALGVEPAVEAAWDEQAFGEWDGLTFKEIHAQSPDALARLRNDATYPAPGGESRAELDERVSDALDRAVALGGVVVVVTHRIVIMSVLARLLGLDIEAGWRLAAAPASLTGIEVWRDGNAQIAFTNDTHHLR